MRETFKGAPFDAVGHRGADGTVRSSQPSLFGGSTSFSVFRLIFLLLRSEVVGVLAAFARQAAWASESCISAPLVVVLDLADFPVVFGLAFGCRYFWSQKHLQVSGRCTK
jgi:hypothetical protein